MGHDRAVVHVAVSGLWLLCLSVSPVCVSHWRMPLVWAVTFSLGFSQCYVHAGIPYVSCYHVSVVSVL